MNLRLIINGFLIILVVHLLLENLNFHMTIGEPTQEMFTDYVDQEEPNDYDPKEELLAYINSGDANPTIARNAVVKPGNYYTSDLGNPTADSNVTDIRQFYNYNWADKENKKDLQQAETMIDQMSQQPSFLSPNGNIQPDTWKYKNELPMNGGAVMGGVYGYDNLESNFAMFDDKGLVIKSCSNPHPDDDIRSGMGAPNMQSRLTGGNL